MASMPIYGKSLKIFSSPEPWNLESWNKTSNVCSNDNPRLKFDFPMRRLDCSPFAIFSRTIEVSSVIFGTNTLLTKSMEIYLYKDQRMTFVSRSQEFAFQMISLQKPPSRFWQHFIFSLQGLVERKFIHMVPVCGPRWPPCPYLVKKHLKIFFFRTKRLGTLKLGTKHQELEAANFMFKW